MYAFLITTVKNLILILIIDFPMIVNTTVLLK